MNESPDIKKIIESIGDNYAPLSSACMEDLKNVSRIFSTDKSTLLVKEGQYSDKTYFIVEGCARAFYLKDGKDVSEWFAFENDFISAINSFFMNAPSPHYIEVLEPSILLELSREDVMMLADKYHDFERLVRIIVTKTMLRLQQRLVSIQFETARQKFETLLQTRPDITQRVSLTHIASYLGITLETLSRIRNQKNRI